MHFTSLGNLSLATSSPVHFSLALEEGRPTSKAREKRLRAMLWALSIQPKIPVISVATSNGTDHFGLVRPEYSGSALKVVLFDRSGLFGWSDRNVPFHLTKLLFPVPLFCILLTRTITRRAVACVGSVQPECTVPLGTWNFRNFKPEFVLNGKRSVSLAHQKLRNVTM